MSRQARNYAMAFIFFLSAMQPSKGQLLQLTGGLSLSQNTGGDGYEMVWGSMRAGYRIGITADFPLSPSLSIQPGLFFSDWGSKFPGDSAAQMVMGSSPCRRRSLRLHYIQVPVLIAHRWALSLSKGLMAGIGPYIAFRINDPSEKFTLGSTNNHVSGNLSWTDGSGEEVYKRVDAGLCFNITFELRDRCNISFQYDNGLRNIIRYDNDIKLYNQACSFSIGYYINRKQFIRRRFPDTKDL